jgi:threonine/homoserine/homoserine lactone efflux protein
VAFNVNGTLWNVFVAWMATRLLGPPTAAQAVALWLNRVLGGLLVSLGVTLALSERS